MLVIAIARENRFRLPVVTGGLILGLGLCAAAALGSGHTPRLFKLERVTKVAAVVPVVDQREVILDVIREHRRTTDDSWRRRLADAIYDEAVAADVDPLMVASIVAKESSFRSRVVSHAGAVGLMQLRPWVAEDMAERARIEWNGLETLHAPDLNVRLGILYYQELVDDFDGDPHLALAAYNNGPSRLRRQLRSGSFAGSDYAERVLSYYQELKSRRSGAPATS